MPKGIPFLEATKWGFGALLGMLIIGLTDQLCGSGPVCVDWNQPVLDTVPLGWVLVGTFVIVADRIKARRNQPEEGTTNEKPDIIATAPHRPDGSGGL